VKKTVRTLDGGGGQRSFSCAIHILRMKDTCLRGRNLNFVAKCKSWNPSLILECNLLTWSAVQFRFKYCKNGFNVKLYFTVCDKVQTWKLSGWWCQCKLKKNPLRKNSFGWNFYPPPILAQMFVSP
jgi:hypothetical protein